MATRVVLALSALFLAAVAAYVVWHRGQFLDTASRSVMFLGVPSVGCLLCLAAQRFASAPRAMVAITLVSAAVAVYGFEAYLTARKMALRAEPVPVAGADPRTKYEVARDLRAAGRDAYPSVFPAYLMQTALDGKLHSPIAIAGREILPLGGVAHAVTVLCNEAGPYITYESDRYGFNNADAMWDTPVSIAAVGDSFTQGVCVPPDRTYSALLGAINLGSSGAGPLIELAALREYLPTLKPRVVLWFYFEGNDLPGDLAIEKKSPLLMSYLDDGRQGLLAHAKEINAALRRYVDALIAAGPDRVETSAGRLQDAISFIGLSELRAAMRLPDSLGDADYPLLSRTLAKAKQDIASWGGALYLVYIPSACAALGKCGQDPLTIRHHVFDMARELGLNTIDLTAVLRAYPDPPALFTRREGGHFGVVGNKVVADAVRARLAADGLPSGGH